MLAAYRIQPWGDDWQQAATIAAVTCNVWRGKRRALMPDDFIPSSRKRFQSEQDMEIMLKAMAAENNRKFE